jgi:hypothetical protein
MMTASTDDDKARLNSLKNKVIGRYFSAEPLAKEEFQQDIKIRPPLFTTWSRVVSNLEKQRTYLSRELGKLDPNNKKRDRLENELSQVLKLLRAANKEKTLQLESGEISYKLYFWDSIVSIYYLNKRWMCLFKFTQSSPDFLFPMEMSSDWVVSNMVEDFISYLMSGGVVDGFLKVPSKKSILCSSNNVPIKIIALEYRMYPQRHLLEDGLDDSNEDDEPTLFTEHVIH